MKRFLLLVICLYVVSVFCHKQTDGFALGKVATQLLQGPGPHLDESLLEQPYHYLGKGGQCYIFASDDGRYILKLLRSSKLNTLHLLHALFPLPSLQEKMTVQQELITQTLGSYLLAHDQLQEETGIVGVHLDGHAPLRLALKIIDKGKTTHIIDPNRYPFVIQKRATLVKEKITQLMDDDPEKARIALRRLFALLHQRIDKGIEDDDPNLSKNFGFCADIPIQIDGGRFSLNTSPSIEKIGNSKEDLQHWINQQYPQLSEDFHHMYEDFLHEVL